MSKPRFTAIDLFCGCGGLTQGLKEAGFQVIGALDNDPIAVETYRSNHGEVGVVESDITQVDPRLFMKGVGLKVRELSLLAGCPPCQGFSTIRTLNGRRTVVDKRNDLLFEFLRFAKALRPQAIMLENVPGLRRDSRFECFVDRMKEMGYKGSHRILNAEDYGVPQRRRRLIYMAGLGNTIPFARPSSKMMTVRQAIGDLPAAGQSGDSIHDLTENRKEKTLELIRKIPPNGGSRGDLPGEFQLPCHQTCDGFKDVYGRMAWDKVAPTITGGCFNPSKGRFLHPEEHRAITMREAALLQGFPRSYRFPSRVGKTALAVMIGNALPPPFIKAHAQSIIDQLVTK